MISHGRQTWDAVIVGAGPCGCVAAKCLAEQGWDVLILDGGEKSGLRVGETVPPEIVQALQEVGLAGQFLATNPLRSFGIVSKWGDHGLVVSDFIFNKLGTGFHLDRRRFDEILQDAAVSAGASIRRPYRLRNVRHDGYWRLEVTQGEQNSEIVSRYVVDASGRARAFACRVGVRTIRFDRMIARCCHLRFPHAGPLKQVLRIEAMPAGWWYWSPLPTDDENAAR